MSANETLLNKSLMIKRHLIGCGIKLALEKGNVLVWDWPFGVALETVGVGVVSNCTLGLL